MPAKRLCEGTGRPAIENPDEWKRIYPTCPVCLRDFGAAGPVASRRYENAWDSIPRHYVGAA